MKHSPRFLSLTQDVRLRVHETTLDELRAKIEADWPFYLIDVREDHEWADGHIPGAWHLCRGILERDIERLVADPDEEIILYCGGGYRSALAAESLLKMGYHNVSSFFDGWAGWRKARLPVAR